VSKGFLAEGLRREKKMFILPTLQRWGWASSEKKYFEVVAENPTPLWSHHTILRSDGTWLSEWSDGMGERSGGAVRSRGFLGRASLGKNSI
jgi:hypothetical protein